MTLYLSNFCLNNQKTSMFYSIIMFYAFVSEQSQQYLFQTDQQATERNMPTTYTCESKEGDDFILDFEQFVSEQEIFYFGTDMKFSMLRPYLILG